MQSNQGSRSQITDREYWALFQFAGALLERLGGSVSLTDVEILEINEAKYEIHRERSASLQDDTTTFRLRKIQHVSTE